MTRFNAPRPQHWDTRCSSQRSRQASQPVNRSPAWGPARTHEALPCRRCLLLSIQPSPGEASYPIVHTTRHTGHTHCRTAESALHKLSQHKNLTNSRLSSPTDRAAPHRPPCHAVPWRTALNRHAVLSTAADPTVTAMGHAAGRHAAELDCQGAPCASTRVQRTAQCPPADLNFLVYRPACTARPNRRLGNEQRMGPLAQGTQPT